MHQMFTAGVVAFAVLSLATGAAAQDRFEPPAARSAQGRGAALTLPSNASPRAALAQYLRAEGRDEATVESLVEAGRTPGRGGVTHVRFEQRAGGLPVYGTYAKAAFGARGELLNVIENLASVPSAVRRAEVSAEQAIAAAIAHHYPELRTVPAGFFHVPPGAAAVAIPGDAGSMAAGFVVQTWTERDNQLHETLVGGNGEILFVELRTNSDSYNVFRINPTVTAQTVTPGAGAGNEQSPIGWLFAGSQGSTNIKGNNASAYLDAASDNVSDGNGDLVNDGNFVTAWTETASPSTLDNREVAVQNLFYLNNLIHDVLYRHGFTESALNFQEDNFGKGGLGSDSVNAEAQDGGGTDNANFATPSDGQNPRMQMYLWSGTGTHEVKAGSQTFLAQGAGFGAKLDTTGITATIRLVTDGVSPVNDGCEALPSNSMLGVIALVDRGTCDFVVKARNAQNAGAVALIVANNRGGDDIIVMGGSDRKIRIPAVLISQNSGVTLKAMLEIQGTVKLADAAPLQRDGDVDADIVFHEYCHGLTWRMIGSMSGPIAGAIGEGMSDVCALLLTVVTSDGQLTPGADAIGEYSASLSTGIRRQAYTNYDLITYGKLGGSSVHDDGELYAAIIWRLLVNEAGFGTSRTDELFGYLVDGMNHTPPSPTFEQMRDGILQSVGGTLSAGSDACKVWQAFAHYGVGVGATASVRGKRITITESFAVPASCTP